MGQKLMPDNGLRGVRCRPEAGPNLFTPPDRHNRKSYVATDPFPAVSSRNAAANSARV
jgi:hypothetical protein